MLCVPGSIGGPEEGYRSHATSLLAFSMCLRIAQRHYSCIYGEQMELHVRLCLSNEVGDCNQNWMRCKHRSTRMLYERYTSASGALILSMCSHRANRQPNAVAVQAQWLTSYIAKTSPAITPRITTLRPTELLSSKKNTSKPHVTAPRAQSHGAGHFACRTALRLSDRASRI
jgi:hypothetical protein